MTKIPSRFRAPFALLALAALFLGGSAFAFGARSNAQASVSASFVARGGLPTEATRAPHVLYRLTCRDAAGNVKWEERLPNLVTTQGGNDLLDKYFKGSAYTAAWYMMLAGAGTKAAGDTLASHAGWSEVTPYAGTRPAITWGTTSAKSNTGTAVSFSINATATVAGAAIVSVSSTTSGILYSVSDFAASRSVVSGDTLSVTPTVSD